ncbi:MAG TPA: acetyl-CoA carboxylase carboxyltransferase subunit alpha [Candidatus Alectryocaccobium stercorigallinarum]|nr:acetyl-CoA carboxylase carboxyltransferase subunit alpha [Candidatus Alectryocaccobium stercorigallinarum]
MPATEVSAFEKVNIARSKGRPLITDYIKELFDDFVELKGDRLFREDPSILGGIASFHGFPVTVIGHRKGRNTNENIKYNFGMTSPEGYRKAMRLMKEAERFRRPVITFIDTPGAYPGMEAESNGQANAIAESMALMSTLRTPVMAVVTGEGSSGGALAIGVADRVYMLENAVYSILSPEGFASIMWKDPSRAAEAASVMKLTAQDLYEYGLIDKIVPEKNLYRNLDRLLYTSMLKLKGFDVDELVSKRYRKFRHMDGIYKPVDMPQDHYESDPETEQK